MKRAIIGAGGFAKEIFLSLPSEERNRTTMFVSDDWYNPKYADVLPLSKLDENEYEVIVAIADCKIRERIVNSLPKNTKYFTYIHPTAQIHDENVEIGEGSIICANVIITTNVKLGKHTHLNISTSVSHDCVIGDFFTASPSVTICGNETIGDRVFFGAKSCIKEKLTVCDDVVIGLNSGVIRDIIEPGVYVGTPAKKIKI